MPREPGDPALQPAAMITLAATVTMARFAGVVYERAILRTGARLRLRQVLKTAS